MPDDPALYTATLSAAGLFETVAFTDEDRKRAEYYSGNAQRAAIQAQSGDIETYLASLAMEITFQPFDEPGRKRITQLINKSNQFNLTTKRLTEPEVASLESDGSTFTLQVRLSDIFGDNGMISVIICSPRPDNCWHIDVWLMSCRVLGRGVERMVLREILRHARRRGISLLTGAYVPSGRNALVEQHYAQLGFTLVETSEDGGTTWALPIVDGAEPPAAPMLVRAVGFDEGVSLGLG
jgi:FkbH-like protein